MPTKLIGSTARAASLLAAGEPVTAGVVSAEVAALTSEVLKIMLLGKIKIATMALLVVLSGTGLIWVMSEVSATEQKPADQRKYEGRPVRPHDTLSDAGTDSTPKSDAERIQGIWDLVILEEPLWPKEVATAWKKSGNRTLIITSEKISYPGGMSGKYTLDSSKIPKRLYVQVPEGRDKGRIIPGIYRLDGDELTIFQGRSGDTEPPSDFYAKESRPGAPERLWVFKRRSSPKNSARSLKELEEQVTNLRTQLRQAEANLKRAQEETKASVAHPAK